jgi:hypothetical protein
MASQPREVTYRPDVTAVVFCIDVFPPHLTEQVQRQIGPCLERSRECGVPLALGASGKRAPE